MPRASAFLVHEDNHLRLEDRFNTSELWCSQTIDGRWMDEAGRIFMLATLSSLPPTTENTENTRILYAKSLRTIKRRDEDARKVAIQALTPFEIAKKPTPPRQLPRGYKDVDYWQGTNQTAIVCAYLPEKCETWRLAMWMLAEGDDYGECLKTFENEFLEYEAKLIEVYSPSVEERQSVSERDALRMDAKHSIANYDSWHFSDATEFAILDDLSEAKSLIATITNEMAIARAKYVEIVPTELNITNLLCVARIFASRSEYLEAVGEDMEWSAAYWSPIRRELVAYLPEAGEKQLLKTLRHETFHQYLSYATAMIPVSPWLNEGYAQYFEQGVDEPFVDPADMISYAELIVPLLMMDYEEFYGGTDYERQTKYRIALSIVYFLEKGAPKVRFAPFKNLKADYFKELFRSKDMREATKAAFKNEDQLKLFVSEWVKFWENQ